MNGPLLSQRATVSHHGISAHAAPPPEEKQGRDPDIEETFDEIEHVVSLKPAVEVGGLFQW